MSTTSSSSSNREMNDQNSGQQHSNDANFDCNICLDIAKDAVVSMCGHLFCWPCLHQWLLTKPTRQTCPVCKAAISRDKVIPLYGRGSEGKKDPRSQFPPRPPGQRTEHQGTGSSSSDFNFPNFNFGDSNGGFHMSFGIGAFPFGFFASTFNFGDQTTATGNRFPNGQELSEDQFLSKLFLWIALVFIIWLLIA